MPAAVKTVSSSSMADPEEPWSWDDSDSPLITPRSHSSCFSETCAACNHRRQRNNLLGLVLLVWAVPLALAAGKWYGLLGPSHNNLNDDPRGHLVLAQVIFRHGARTPLSNLYWPNTTWTHCSQHPLAAIADSSSSSKGITLQLYDPAGAPNPPELSGDEEPQLPGGCRMGSLTDAGFQNAIDLGTQLRRTYIEQHKLLPPRQLDAKLLHVESTAVQRTVTTLRGVLNGLYPNSSGVVTVAVRPHQQEIMSADWQGCHMLGNLTQQLADIQADRDANDPAMQELQHQARSSLQLPEDASLSWNRLRDELACMEAEGQSPPVAAQQQKLIRRIDYVTTKRRVQISAPELGDCLLGRDQQEQCQQVTALTTGRLLDTFLTNMQDAATAHGNNSDSSAGANADALDSSNSSPLAASRRLLATAPRSTSVNSGSNATTTISSSNSSSSGKQVRQQVQQTPKLMLFAAHDTTLVPLLSAVGQHQVSWPNFTSYLSFELWKHRGQHYVRILHDGQPLRLILSPDSGGDAKAGDVGGAVGVVGSYNVADAGEFVRGLVSKLAGYVSWVVDGVDRWIDSMEALLSGILGWSEVQSEIHKRLQRNGQGGYARSASVVSLQDFRQRVVQDYVMAPGDYASACSAGGSGSGSLRQGKQAPWSEKQWLAQFQ